MQHSQQRRQLYEEGVEQYAESIYRVAYRLTGHHELARELAQETFLAAWQGIASLQQPAAFKGWLFSILRNQFSKQLGREKRNRHQSLDAAGLQAIFGTEGIYELGDPHNPHQAAEIVDSVQQALLMLDEDQRMAILLVTMEDWSTEEAAAFLDIPKGTVLSRLYRARQRLKTLLASDWNLGDESPRNASNEPKEITKET